MTGSASLSTSPCLILARVAADKRLSDGFFLDGVAAPDCSCEVVALDCKLVTRGCELVTQDVGVDARDVGVEVRDVGVVAGDIALVASDVALVPRELGVQTLKNSLEVDSEFQALLWILLQELKLSLYPQVYIYLHPEYCHQYQQMAVIHSL